MPTFNAPVTDAREAGEALRGLAHASRTFTDPADIYPVLGELLAGVRALRQVTEQIAVVHLQKQDRAVDDAGEQIEGARAAVAAATELRVARTLLDQVHERLDAGMSQSGRIAWHPAPPLPAVAQVRELDAARTTAQVGTLTLTVWPITPLGVHLRYGYLIEDGTTGHVSGGRNLFTGTEPVAPEPVAPEHAIRELVTALHTDASKRDHALEHPGEPEAGFMFSEQIVEAARANDAALSTFTTTDVTPSPEEPEPNGKGRWISVVFFQGEDADRVLNLIEEAGTDAAIDHLAGYDFGDETEQAALANGYVYDQLPARADDRTAIKDAYALTYSPAFGHVSLLRRYDAAPDPVLLDLDARSILAGRDGLGSVREALPPRPERSGASRFGYRPGAVSSSRGLAL